MSLGPEGVKEVSCRDVEGGVWLLEKASRLGHFPNKDRTWFSAVIPLRGFDAIVLEKTENILAACTSLFSLPTKRIISQWTPERVGKGYSFLRRQALMGDSLLLYLSQLCSGSIQRNQSHFTQPSDGPVMNSPAPGEG